MPGIMLRTDRTQTRECPRLGRGMGVALNGHQEEKVWSQKEVVFAPNTSVPDTTVLHAVK
jgi:hypothetical protein